MNNQNVYITVTNDDTQHKEDTQLGGNPNSVTNTDEYAIDENNDDVGSEEKGIRYRKSNESQREINDDAYGFKVKHKKDHNDSVGAYLISEFSGLKAQSEVKHDGTDNLPKYKEIDMTGFIHKYIDERKREEGNKPYVFFKDVVWVQFMGSETMPENKVLMTYEPETRNYTVKGMFVRLLFMHFFTFAIATFFFIYDIREGLILYGHLICLPFLALFVSLVVVTACFRICRNACCTCMAGTFAVLSLSFFYSALGGYLGKRIFIFNNVALFISDIFLIFILCGEFDFTTKGAYVLAIGSVLAGLLLCIPVMEFGAQNNVYYWASDEFPQENVFSYLITVIFSVITAMVEIAELQLLLSGDWVELGESDYSFGAYLMFVSLVDYPIRFSRKKGWLDSCNPNAGDDDEE
nr:uncharacterized protein LOC110377289 [Helicoverpa armigera]